MMTKTIRLLAALGAICLFLGLYLFLGGAQPAAAQDTPRYVGTEECSECHRSQVNDHRESAHGLALQDTTEDKDAILADFASGESLRTISLPGADAARPFTADDIAYVVGAGRRVQRFLIDLGEGQLAVLPAEWNVQTAAWAPVSLATQWPDPAYDWNQNCAYCHVTGLEPSGEWEEVGVQCEACHGPGSEHLRLLDEGGNRLNDEELAAVRGAVNLGLDPQTCAQCHSRGTDSEGRPFPLGYIPGQDLSAIWTPFPPDDTAHWTRSGHARLTNMQSNEWAAAGHSKSLVNLQAYEGEVAPECLTCHSQDYTYTLELIDLVQDGDREGDPPDDPTIETVQYGVTCRSCHDPHSDDGRPANLIAEPYELCVSCHSTANFTGEGVHHPVQEMFEGRAIIEQVAQRASDHFLEPDGPDCATCHLPAVPTESGSRASHSLMPVLPGMNLEGVIDTCTVCHEDQVDAATMQRLIDDVQTNTRARIEAARAAVTPTTAAWVITALDFVEGDGSAGIHNYAYADELLDAVFAELGLFPAAGQ